MISLSGRPRLPSASWPVLSRGAYPKRGRLRFMAIWTRISLPPAAAAVITFAFLLPPETRAQWLDYPTPGIPRTPDGKPNLVAPVPRSSDGKPDLSGIWRGPGPGSYDRNVARDLKQTDIQPWAEAIYRQRVRN